MVNAYSGGGFYSLSRRVSTIRKYEETIKDFANLTDMPDVFKDMLIKGAHRHLMNELKGLCMEGELKVQIGRAVPFSENGRTRTIQYRFGWDEKARTCDAHVMLVRNFDTQAYYFAGIVTKVDL